MWQETLRPYILTSQITDKFNRTFAASFGCRMKILLTYWHCFRKYSYFRDYNYVEMQFSRFRCTTDKRRYKKKRTSSSEKQSTFEAKKGTILQALNDKIFSAVSKVIKNMQMLIFLFLPLLIFTQDETFPTNCAKFCLQKFS